MANTENPVNISQYYEDVPVTEDPNVTLMTLAEQSPFDMFLLHPLSKLEYEISLYCDPVICILGILGNLCTFFVMWRPVMRTSSSSVYFRALAVFDSLFLARMLFFQTSLSYAYFDFLRASNIVCKIGDFFAPFSLDMAAWTVLAVTAERMVVVTWPLRAKAWCTHRTAHVVIGVLAAVFGLLWAAILVVYRGPGIGKCDNTEYYAFLYKYGLILSLTTSTLIPTPTLVIINIILAFRLYKIGANRTKHLDQKSTPNITKATKTTLLISVTYVILTLPVSGFNFLQTFYDFIKYPKINFIGMQCIRVRYINHGINFLIYLLGLPKVRLEMKAMMTCSKKPIYTSDMRSKTFPDGAASGTELNAIQRPSVSTASPVGERY